MIAGTAILSERRSRWAYFESGDPDGTSDGSDDVTTSAIEVDDIDGDGDKDIVVGNKDGPGSVFLNDGDGTFTEQSRHRRPPAAWKRDIGRDGGRRAVTRTERVPPCAPLARDPCVSRVFLSGYDL